MDSELTYLVCQAAGMPFFFKQWGGTTPKASGPCVGWPHLGRISGGDQIMSLFARPGVGTPAERADNLQLQATARIDVALTEIDRALRAARRHNTVSPLLDALLDVRLILTGNPPRGEQP